MIASANSATGILLIHGMTGAPLEMKPVARYLKRHGYRVETPTLRGHGAGHKELLATNWHDWLDGMRKDAATLCGECDRVYLVGLSASALIAVLIANDNPKIAGLILLSTHLGIYRSENVPWNHFLLAPVMAIPLLRRHAWWTETAPFGIKDPRLQRNIQRAVDASKSGETPAGTFRTYVESIYQAQHLIREGLAAAPAVKAPALVVHSLEDTMHSIRNSTRLYARLGSRSKKLVLINGCDHVMTVDLRKEYVAGLIDGFIREQEGLPPRESVP